MNRCRRLALWGALALAACSSPTEPEWEAVVGVIDVGTEWPDVLRVPEAVLVGLRFEVQVTTFGSSSCTREAGAVVSQQGMTADITPYDRVAPAGTACTDDLAPLPRTVVLRFDSPGTATIRLHGQPAGTVVQRQVVVRP